MNLERIYAAAASNSGYLNNKDYLKVYIGASADNPGLIDVFNSFRIHIDKLGVKAKAIVTGSSGYYDLEPIVSVAKPDESIVLYRNVAPEMASGILKEQAVNDSSTQGLAFCSIGSQRISGIPHMSDIPLFNLQKRVALRNCGFTDPEDMDHYILLCQGYSGLSKALKMDRMDVISEIKRADSRGQGETFCEGGDGKNFVFCNAIEIDPQSAASGLLLESDPHSVLEGMLIAASAIGARNCLVYINSKYGPAIKRLNKALEQMRRYGLLGNNILGSAFSCDIEIRALPDSQISEVEAALLGYMDRKRPLPYLLKGSLSTEEFGSEFALTCDAETMSNISAVFQKGSSWHSDLEAERSRGTRIVSLSGDIIHQYTVEVPFGTTLRSIIMNIGGGTTRNKNIKAAQFGGPTGVFLDAGSLDTRVDLETIERTGGLTGSGRIEVFCDDFCPVEVTRNAISYLRSQSCGKCVFCREGSLQMSDILKDIAEGIGKTQDLELLIELGEAMKIGSLCALGQTLPNAALSSLILFREDYDIHIKEKRCQLKNI
jgi:NADH-quinone oxidoreductase subunit F